jgi:hypothetical protein
LPSKETIDKCDQQVVVFKSLLEELRKELLDASIYFDIWVQLWPTPQVVDVINRYKGFFLHVRKTLLDQFSIKICNVLSNDSTAPSFYRIFKILENNPSLASTIDPKPLRKRLKQHRKVLDGIKHYRNKKAAHWDTQVVAEKKPVLYGDSKKLLKELQEVFNVISGAATKRVWSFKISQHGDTTALLDHLNELMSTHQERIDDLGKGSIS